MEQEKILNEEELHGVIRKLLNLVILLSVTIVLIPIVILSIRFFEKKKSAGERVEEVKVIEQAQPELKPIANFWMAPDVNAITDASLKAQIEYGKDLIAHTAKYLGPNGSVAQMTNGLNCQNCHLNAGTKVYGINYGSVASTYPKLRARSGSVENIYKRVNDCFERSLNGQALDTTSKEMQAIVAYINFLGSNVEKGKKAEGSGFKDLGYLERAADPKKGKLVYETKCQSCHQPGGNGLLNPDKTEYSFPPLWGTASYNDGAGLYRLSNFAKYVKYNMPQGASHESPQLTDEEAWDVAAFVNSQPRPHINVPQDWPDKSKKPVDHPFGPYKDNFTEKQHKFGPFQPIVDEQKKNAKK